MPDGKTPDLNDGCRRDVKGSYEVRKRIIPNDKRAKWITEGDEIGKPEYTSAAYAMVRLCCTSYWLGTG